MWLHKILRTILTHKKWRALVIISGLAIVVSILLGTCAGVSVAPEAVNMSTASDQSMKMPDTEAPIPIADLTLGETDAPLKVFDLTAEVVTRKDLPDEWAYNGQVPGPELRVKQGDHVRVTLKNQLPVATTIHWHGVNVPNIADGVAGLTQDAVKPGQSYTYDFIADEAGTYWYHSHQDTSNQVPHGLFGALIVEPVAKKVYDRDYTLVYHDLKVPNRDFGAVLSKVVLRQVDRAGVAVNGSNTDSRFEALPSDFVRLRIINATAGEQDAYGKPLRIVPEGVDFQVIALDGHDLNKPTDLTSKILALGSGQRYDITFHMPAGGSVCLYDMDQRETVTVGTGQIPALSPEKELTTFDLTNYGVAAPDPIVERNVYDIDYTIDLNARAGFHNGSFGLTHTINGEDSPNVPMLMIRSGQTVRLHIVNHDFAKEYHPIHIHGHYFTVLSKNGRPIEGSPIHLDTILLGPDETWDVAFVANNPGLWMLHCHILKHAETGMSMMMSYPNISTPYEIGRRSGNIPE